MKNQNSNPIEKSVKKFYNSLISNKQGFGFRNYVGFRIFQTVSENVKSYMTADYKFYKDKEYYYPAKIGITTKIAAGIMLPIIFFMMRDLGPGNTKKG